MRRSHLLLSTALRAASLMVAPAAAALAQTAPAPTALPTGMQVVAGRATGAVAGSALDVTQQSSRAALDWKSFDIGAQATVQFHTPAPQSVTLNRVISANASQIAGRLSSNGQLIVINQSGVVFLPGSVVDAQSIVASAAGISQANMRAGVLGGRFVLDQPANAGARVDNQGNITVRQAGLAALVAPQVANSGVIHAPLGHVVLAGVASNVVDLYGDGMLSIDVTKQSMEMTDQSGAKHTALVTNTGTIVAEGGTVTLTTAAVEGVIDNLVSAGGSVSVASATGQGGHVAIDAQGGDAAVTGKISARGATKGGDILATASGAVAIGGTARLDASGRNGGGTIAVGTTLARAVAGPNHAAPTARTVTIAPGATLIASATRRGNGGNITVLSTDSTVVAGSVIARGGARGGNGGAVELSGDKAFAWSGSPIDVGAPAGHQGSITFDPAAVDIVHATGTSNPVTPPFVDNGTTASAFRDIDLNALTGVVTISATGTLTVDAAATLSPAGGLLLRAGSSVLIDGTIALTGAAGATLLAGTTDLAGSILIGSSASPNGTITTGAGGAVVLTTNAAGSGGIALTGVLSSGAVTMSSGAGGIRIGGTLTAATRLDASSTGTIAELASLGISTPLFTSSGGAVGTVSLSTSLNAIKALGTIAVTNAGTPATSSLLVTTTTSLDVTGPLTAGGITLRAGGTIGLAGNVNAASSLDLAAATGVTQTVGTLSTGLLTSSGGITGGVAIAAIGNAIAAIGPFAVTGGDLAIGTSGATTIANAVSVDTGRKIAINAASIRFTPAINTGTLIIPGGSLSAAAGVVELAPPDTAAGTLFPLTLGRGAASAFLLDTDLGLINAATLRIGQTGTSLTAEGITVSGTLALPIVGRTRATATLELDAGAQGITFGDATAAAVSASAIALNSGGGVTETAASVLTTPHLGANVSAGTIDLGGTFNAIGTLDAVTANGAVTIVDRGSLTVGDTLSAAGQAVSLNVGLNLTINAPITAASLNIVNAAAVTQSAAGTLVIGALLGATTDVITLTDPNNAIASLGSLSAGGGLEAITLATNGDLTITGPVSGSTVDLSAAGTLSESGGGAINATTLASAAGLGGNVTLLGANTITALGAIAATGTVLALDDASALAVNGAVSVTSGGTVSLTTPALTFGRAGSLSAGTGLVELAPHANSAVTLGAGGTLLQSSGLSHIIADTLRIGGARGVTTAQSIAVAGTFDASGFATLDLVAGAGGVAIGGAASLTNAHALGAISIDSTGALSLGDAATIDTAGVLELGVAGATEISSSVVNAATLLSSGQVSGAIDLTSFNNSIAHVGPFAASPVGGVSELSVNTGSALDVIGGIGAASVTLHSAGSIGIAADIDARSRLDLIANGSVIQTGAGVITTGSLTGSGIVGALTLGSVNNRITGLGPLTVATPFRRSGSMTVTTASALDVIGAIAADRIALTSIGGTIGLAADVNARLSLDLAQATGVTQTGGGTISTATLLSSQGIGGDLSLTHANAIAAIGSLAVTGNATLVDAALLVSGHVSVGDGHTLSIASNAFSLGAGGALAAGPTGLIEIGPDASTTTAVSLGSLGSAGIAPGDLTAITAGTLRLGRSAADPVATDRAASIDVLGNVSATGIGTIDLQTAGAVTQGSGAIAVGTLAAAAGGSISLAGAGNTIAGLGSVSAGGSIDIANSLAGSTLTVSGPVVTTAAGDITLSSPTLAVSGSVTPSNGATLGAGNVNLSTDLLNLGGQITDAGRIVALAPFTAGGTVTVASSTGITAGVVRLGSISGISSVPTPFAGGIHFTGPSNFGTAGGLELYTTGAVVQDAGAVVTAGRLSGQADTLTLDQGNSIATLGSFTAASALTLIDAAPSLAVDGPVSVTGAGLLTLGAATLTIAPAAVAGPVTVASGGGVLLQGNTVDFGAGLGTAVQAGTQVAISTLGNANAAQTLTGTGVVSAPRLFIGGDGAATHATTLLLGAVTLTGTSLDLASQGAIGQTGPLTAAALTGNAGGTVILGNTQNALSALGTFTVGSGDFTLADSAAVTVTGSVSTPGTLRITDSASAASAIRIGAGSTLKAAAVALASTGAVTGSAIDTAAAFRGVPQGVISATSLAASATSGDVVLNGGANTIATLGQVDVAGGSFTLSDSAALQVTGIATVRDTIALVDSAAAAALSIAAGGVLHATAVSLATSATGLTATDTAIGEAPGGVISGTLSASAASGNIALLGAANTITSLGNVTAGASVTAGDTITILDRGTLTLAGTVAATRIGLAADALAYGSGALNAGSLIELAPATATALALGPLGSGGNIDPALLAHSTTPLLRLGQIDGTTEASSIAIAAVTTVAAAALDLQTTGAITETGALLLPGGTITGSAGGNVGLTGANDFAVLGGFALPAADTIAVTDTAALRVGALRAQAITLTGDSLTLTGALTAPGTLTLNARNSVTDSAVISAGALSGAVGADMTLAVAGNSIGTIGDLSVGGTLSLDDAAALVEVAGSRLLAGSLGGAFALGADLSAGSNTIGAIGSLSMTTGSLTLADTGPLAVTGPVDAAAGIIALSATGSLQLGGAVVADSRVSILANGLNETSGGSIAANAAAGVVEIAPQTAAAMTIGTGAGAFDPAALARVTATTLRLGKVASQATASAASIAFAASTGIGAATLDLQSTGSVSAPATASLALTHTGGGVLTGSTGAVQLLGSANSIARLGPYDAGNGSFQLVDTGALSVIGDVTAANVTLAVAGALTIDTGSLLAPAGTVDLTAASGTEDSTGTIAAATLLSSGAPAGAFDLGGANQIAALGAWNGPAGTLTLRDAAATGLVITGSVATGTLDVSSAGTISEAAGGHVTAGVLRSRLGATGAAFGSTNAVGTLADFSVGGGSFALDNGAAPLTVGGTVTASSIALTSTALLTIASGGVLQAPGGTVDLMTAGATETGTGIVNAGTLIGSQGLAGDFRLVGNNSVDTLGAWTTAGALVLVDPGALLQETGPVSASLLALTAGTIQLAGNITAASASFAGAAGGTTQTGAGTLDVGSVTASGSGLNLGAAGNTIATLGSVAVGAGGVLVVDRTTLSVSGPVTATGGAISLTDASDIAVSGAVISAAGIGPVGIRITAGGSLAILDGGSLQVPTGGLDLTSAGAHEAGTGFIAADTLFSSGTPTGIIALTGAGNVVANLGSFVMTGGALELTDSTKLTVGDTGSVARLVLAAPTIAIAGTLNGGTVDLSASAGGVSETGAGKLLAGLLTSGGNVVGGVTLTNPANAVTTLGAFVTTGGDFRLTSLPALSVAGIVSAPDIVLSAPGSLAIVDGGALLAPGFVDLTASNASESGSGFIRARTLQSSGGLGVATLAGANTIDVLGSLTGSGALSLTDSRTLTLSGPVTAPNLTLTAPGLIFAGNQSGQSLDLEIGAGGVSQSGGVITVGLLTGAVAGATTLGDANAIATIGPFTSDGAMSLINVISLTLVDVLNAPGGIAVGIAGTLSESAPGTLLTTSLSGSATGDVTLDGLRNTIGNIAFATNANLTLTDSVDLTVNGALSAQRLALTINGDLVQDVGAPITAGLFTGSANNMTLPAANQIAGIGSLTVPGTFTLLNARDLVIAGTMTSGTTDISTAAGNLSETGTLLTGRLQSSQGIQGSVDLTSTGNSLSTIGNLTVTGSIDYASNLDPVIDGAVVAPFGLTLNVVGALSETALGTITAPTLQGSALGGATLDNPANAIGAVAFNTGRADFALADSVALSITGPLSGRIVTITDPAAVTENGGVITAAGFNGSAASFSLGGANRITSLGNVAAPGGLLLVEAGALTIGGTVQTSTFDLSVLSGGVTESGQTQTGAVVADRLSSGRGIAGGMSLVSAGNRIGTLGNIQTRGALVILDNTGLTLAGLLSAPIVDLSTTAGGIAQAGGAIVTSLLDSSFGISGNAGFTSQGNRIATLGQMAVSGDLALTDASTLGIGGPVAAANMTLTTAGGVSVAGDVSVPGTLTLSTGGSFVRSGGRFAVGTVTGLAVSTADFGAASNIGTLNAFTVTDEPPGAAPFSNLAVDNAQPLTVSGGIASDYIRVSATGLLTWSGDVTTFGLPRAQQVAVQPTPPGSYMAVVADAQGRAVINQIGNSQIIPQDGPVATVRLNLPATGGQIVFSNLTGPNADLILFTGAGTATGRISVGDLFVSGRNGGTSLLGVVAGQFGSAAARASFITPKPDTNYRINSCPLRSVNCILLPLATVAPTNPLQDLSIGQARDDQDDSDVLLPNVSDKDY